MTTTSNTFTITHPTIGNVDILYFDNGLKHQWDKLLTFIDVPKQTTPYTWIIDLKRLHEVITVTGILEDTTSESMWTKLLRLRQIMQTSGTMSISWDTNDTNQPYTVNILKGEVVEKFGAMGDESSDTKYFEVTLQFVVGLHKGGS